MCPDDDNPGQSTARVIETSIKQELEESYLAYSMSVIIGRAIPDVRDGLKPVHRRILYSMYEQGIRHNSAHKKCARIVGDVIGKYHPHGDQAVYNALVRMAQEFSLRYPLIDGQGNFGSIDGDAPAAYRYTEARLAPISEEMLADIEKGTVPYQPNYDETEQEPVFLPAKIPNLLVNGASGIAVGMSTSMPPFNLGEVLDAVMIMLDRDLSISELMEIIPGPDFPTGGLIMGQKGIFNAYRTGRGTITIRARTHMEEVGKTKRTAIVVTEIPYMVNKAQEIESIAKKINEGTLKGIVDLRDESNRKGIRIVFILGQNANYNVVLNNLFKMSRLQTSFHVSNLVLDNGQPKIMNMKALIRKFIEHREDIIIKRTEHDLQEARKRLHVIEGLLVALEHVDRVIEIIKQSKSPDDAQSSLIREFNLSEVQAEHILNMRLRRLTALEGQKLEEERDKLVKFVLECEKILGSKDERKRIIKEECLELKEKYKKLLPRRSEIVKIQEDVLKITKEDLIKEEDVVILITNNGYIKRIPLSSYETQRRGGVGKRAMKTREDDFINDVFVASTHNYLLILTNRGRMYRIKVYEVPEGSRASKGKSINSLVPLEADEKVSTVVQVEDFSDDNFLILATKNGLVKKTILSAFGNIRNVGIRAIRLRDGDEIIGAKISTGEHEIVLGTKKGMACRFPESDIRPTGRNSIGVKGINLYEGDEVVALVTVDEGADKHLLTVTKKGYGKRTRFEDYRKIKRGGRGVKNIDTRLRDDEVIYMRSISDDDEIMLVSLKGNMVRIKASEIKVLGRNAAGVIIMRFKEEDDELVGLGLVE